MKKEELQIGDWIECGGIACKVLSIFPRQLTSDDFWIRAESDISIKGFPVDKARPILLTPEMLKANNAEWTGNDICCISLNTCFYLNCIQLKYVHELQHALRLCGLNELANNLKIQ